ncbi:MAG TPA: type II secretion system F family protein [Vitreimonas sp.]|uniref:type II secretion system F family protein n=1 Tax=Vitreimonas sp. TaxID=3069702 RepID=UPI002D6E3B01|nr:type II secretion system F family protein [Vitreimonas sp.]HYD86608.1 type II secretion system F family protein [Vitreimonas sp.]
MDFVKLLTDPLTIAGVLAAGACFATIVTVAAPAMSEDRLGSRLKEVAKKREELRKKSRADLAKSGASLQHKNANQFAKGLVDKLNLQKALADDSLAEKLIRAGLRGQAAQTMFYFYRAALPIGFGVLALLYVLALGAQMPLHLKLIAVVGGVAAGFYGPNLYLKNLADKRRTKIMEAFPDSLDMMLICVESGMSIEMALGRVGQEIAPASVELAEEFALTTAELSYLPERRMAYENLARRTNHPGVKAVAMALTQAEKYGTPVGQALRVMAKENRELRLSEAEKKAASLPPKLTVPMILFFLPVLFAVIIGPAIIQINEILGSQ